MTKQIKKAVLAYSGGLDTSVILKWLQTTYNCEVVTFTADLGQGVLMLSLNWQRLPPPCALQKPLAPTADLGQGIPMLSWNWQRLPPPWAVQKSLAPWADLGQGAPMLSLNWQHLPPP